VRKFVTRSVTSTFLVLFAALSAFADEPAKDDWKPMFDGNTLTGWKVSQYGGDGEVSVADETIVLGTGVSLTGIVYDRETPKTNYELELEAKRTQGIDFFCGLTFPVEESHCSFIVAGWAGAVVGLSCIDGADASQNETTKYMAFKNDRWYKIRVRVTPEKISAWIDDEQVVDQSIVGRKIGLRGDIEDSRPLGVAAYQSTAAVRKMRWRSLEEVKSEE
jgi:hypothetical protein